MTDAKMTDTGAPQISLSKLMSSARSEASCVAFDLERQVSWGEFQGDVGRLCKVLLQSPRRRWALYSRSSYQFSVGLMALWHSNKSVLIPGDNLTATIDHIAPQVDAFLGDFEKKDVEGAVRQHYISLPIIDDELAVDELSNEFKILDRDRCSVTVLTSGSTGLPKFIPIKLRQIEDELQLFESLWGEGLQQTWVISSVSHQHLYGFSFRLCWPLAAGRPFAEKNCSYMEELVSYCKLAPALCLITSPSHLSRLPEALPWDQLHNSWRAVFCSTAPLSADASRDAEAKFDLPVTEVFGSSETGAIAWRRQIQTSYWQALPGVRIAIDCNMQTMRLQSPLLNDPAQWLQTADKIELIGDQQFHLLGRIDRIVKIEGKRISLTAMENRVMEHPWVEIAKALVLLSASGRSELAIVAVLREEGAGFLAKNGKRKLNLNLRECLKDCVELTALPRRWRYPQQLPENSQGKITQQALEILFQSDAVSN